MKARAAMNNRVSIVIPTLNSGVTIEKCLASVVRNNSKYRYEIIVIDGGSSDGTVEVAKRFTNKVFIEDTYFPGVNRNKGIRKAEGDIICFTDSDCVVPKNWIDELVDGLLRLNEKDNKIVGVGGGNIPLLENPSFIELAISKTLRSPLISFGSRHVSIYKDEREVLENPPINSAYFKWALEEVGGFGEEFKIGEDVELDAKIIEKGYGLYYLPNVLVCHKHRSSFKKFFRQMYEFGMARIRVARKYKKYLRFRLYGPIFLCLMTFSPLFFIPLGMGLMNGAYVSLKERNALLFFPLVFLTISVYVAYGAGEMAHLVLKREL